MLSLPEVVKDIGIGFDFMCDSVNSFAAEILAISPDGHDPILYFYENFLETFDPEARQRTLRGLLHPSDERRGSAETVLLDIARIDQADAEVLAGWSERLGPFADEPCGE